MRRLMNCVLEYYAISDANLDLYSFHANWMNAGVIIYEMALGSLVGSIFACTIYWTLGS